MGPKAQGEEPTPQAGDEGKNADNPDSFTNGNQNPESHVKRIERLFREHNAALVKTLAVRLSSPQEAREVAQEAYVRLLGLDDPTAVSLPQRFLIKTAINLANDRLRGRNVRQRLDPLAFFEATSEQVSPSPEQICSDREEFEIVRRALEELPGRCREALFLHRLDGLTMEETAKRLNVTKRTAVRYVKRALEHCAWMLQEHTFPPGRSK